MLFLYSESNVSRIFIGVRISADKGVLVRRISQITEQGAHFRLSRNMPAARTCTLGLTLDSDHVRAGVIVRHTITRGSRPVVEVTIVDATGRRVVIPGGSGHVGATCGIGRDGGCAASAKVSCIIVFRSFEVGLHPALGTNLGGSVGVAILVGQVFTAVNGGLYFVVGGAITCTESIG